MPRITADSRAACDWLPITLCSPPGFCCPATASGPAARLTASATSHDITHKLPHHDCSWRARAMHPLHAYMPAAALHAGTVRAFSLRIGPCVHSGKPHVYRVFVRCALRLYASAATPPPWAHVGAGLKLSRSRRSPAVKGQRLRLVGGRKPPRGAVGRPRPLPSQSAACGHQPRHASVDVPHLRPPMCASHLMTRRPCRVRRRRLRAPQAEAVAGNRAGAARALAAAGVLLS